MRTSNQSNSKTKVSVVSQNDLNSAVFEEAVDRLPEITLNFACSENACHILTNEFELVDL